MKTKILNFGKDILSIQIAGIGVGLMCMGFAMIKICILDDFLKATED